MRYLYLLISLWIVCTCFSCGPSQDHLKLSAYQWKLQAEQKTDKLSRFPIHQVYIHLADIYWDNAQNQPMPKARLEILKDNPLFRYPLIPVLFIDNQVFSRIATDSLEDFAKKIIAFRKDFINNFDVKEHQPQLQIDCDWLASHKDKYFLFLSRLKELVPELVLSTTIRLYPYKYQSKMGVPPVDYGVLMCYNMLPVQDLSSTNSIIDPAVLKQYLTVDKYPIPLKAALPFFGWYVWFRNNQYQSILYLPPDLSDADLLEGKKLNNFTVKRDSSISNVYLRRGDILRKEYPTAQALQESLDLITHNVPDIKEIILYHWDEHSIDQYETFIQNHWKINSRD